MSRYWSVLKTQENNVFSFKVDTTIIDGGSTANNQYQLPLGGGPYDMIVNWGDGSSDNITLYNQAETLHTYPSTGEYVISITGLIGNFSHVLGGADGRDRNKIIDVLSFGNVETGGFMFYNCLNAKFDNVSDVFKNVTANTLSNSFYGIGVTSIKNSNSWDVSNATVLTGTFGAGYIDTPISNWDVSNVTDMIFTFYYAISFNQDISNWDVSNVLVMSNTFTGAYAFNQDISNWNFNINVNLSSFMNDKNSSNYNYQYYDNLLIKLASIMVGSGRTETKQLDMGTIKYSSAGLSARNALIADGWAITDGGSI